jgi:hypothetical protein
MPIVLIRRDRGPPSPSNWRKGAIAVHGSIQTVAPGIPLPSVHAGAQEAEVAAGDSSPQVMSSTAVPQKHPLSGIAGTGECPCVRCGLGGQACVLTIGFGGCIASSRLVADHDSPAQSLLIGEPRNAESRATSGRPTRQQQRIRVGAAS